MKTLMLSTAMLTALAMPALAQANLFRSEMTAGSVRASDLVGARIYASEAALDAGEYSGVQEGWSDIGEINDVIMSREGMVESVLVDIGGFLGMGERQVAVDMTSLQFVSDGATADNAEDWFLVMNADRATIEGAPEWPMAMDATGTGTVADPAMTAETPVPAADAATTADPAMREPLMRDGFTTLAGADLTAEALTGATVYDTTDANIGEVGDLILTADGQVNQVVIDVGGFLGMGQKPVALSLDQVDILRQSDGSDVRVYVALTKDQLEAMPDYIQ